MDERTTASASQGGIVPLFATPFAAVNTGADPQFNARLASLCESQRVAPDNPLPPRDPLHFRGPDGFLDSASAIAGELKHLMLGQASNIVASLNSIDTAEFAKLRVQARGWCSIVQTAGHVPAQHFPSASWLAVYCVQAGVSDAKSSGVLRLYERRLGSMYRDPSISDLKSPYRYGNHTWSPMPGWMAIFPAYLPHEVSVVRSDTSLILVFAMIRFLG